MRSIVSEHAESIRAAISVMGQLERTELEQEASVIQSNFRRWMLRKNFRDVRKATLRLQKFTKTFLARKGVSDARDGPAPKIMAVVDDREGGTAPRMNRSHGGAVDVGASNLPGSSGVGVGGRDGGGDGCGGGAVKAQDVIQLQAATRGALARKQFEYLKRQVSATMVIQKTMRAHMQRKKLGVDFDGEEEEGDHHVHTGKLNATMGTHDDLRNMYFASESQQQQQQQQHVPTHPPTPPLSLSRRRSVSSSSGFRLPVVPELGFHGDDEDSD
jgi:hypothetical protein